MRRVRAQLSCHALCERPGRARPPSRRRASSFSSAPREPIAARTASGSNMLAGRIAPAGPRAARAPLGSPGHARPPGRTTLEADSMVPVDQPGARGVVLAFQPSQASVAAAPSFRRFRIPSS